MTPHDVARVLKEELADWNEYEKANAGFMDSPTVVVAAVIGRMARELSPYMDPMEFMRLSGLKL